MKFDHMKTNCFFYIREIDEVFKTNSSKLDLSKIKHIFLYSSVKHLVEFRKRKNANIDDYYFNEIEAITGIQAAKQSTPSSSSSPSTKTFRKVSSTTEATSAAKASTKRRQSSTSHFMTRQIVRYTPDNKRFFQKLRYAISAPPEDNKTIVINNKNDEDYTCPDEDELILDEYGLMEYYFRLVNHKAHPDFLEQWRIFLDVYVRAPVNILKVSLNRALVDQTSRIINMDGVLKLESIGSLEYVVFAQTTTMVEQNFYLITTTCDYRLTMNYLNQMSVEKYNMTNFVPVLNSEEVFYQLMELLENFNKQSPNQVYRLRKKSKIFFLSDTTIDEVYKFIETNRTSIEFEN